MRRVKFVLLSVFSVMLLWSCNDEVLQEPVDQNIDFEEFVNLIAEDGTELSAEDLGSLKLALESGKNWESSDYTGQVDVRDVIDTRGPCDYVAGAEILSSEIPSTFSLTLGTNATVYGFNAVDDCVNQFKARAKFGVSTTTQDKAVKLYTVNTTTGATNLKYIAVRNYCTQFSYLTGWTSGQIVAVNYCGW